MKSSHFSSWHFPRVSQWKMIRVYVRNPIKWNPGMGVVNHIDFITSQISGIFGDHVFLFHLLVPGSHGLVFRKFWGPQPLHVAHRMYPEVFSEFPDLQQVHLMVTLVALGMRWSVWLLLLLPWVHMLDWGWWQVSNIWVTGKILYRYCNVVKDSLYYPVIGMIGDENNKPL